MFFFGYNDKDGDVLSFRSSLDTYLCKVWSFINYCKLSVDDDDDGLVVSEEYKCDDDKDDDGAKRKTSLKRAE